MLGEFRSLTDRRGEHFGLRQWQRMKEKEENQETNRKSNQQGLGGQWDKGCRQRGSPQPRFLGCANGSTAFLYMEKENSGRSQTEIEDSDFHFENVEFKTAKWKSQVQLTWWQQVPLEIQLWRVQN